MPGRLNAYICTPSRMSEGTPDSVRALVVQIENLLSLRDGGPTPSRADQLAFWCHMEEWAQRNIAEIEGHGAKKRGAASPA